MGRIVLRVTKGGRERAVYPPTGFLNRLRWYIDIDRARIAAAMRRRLGDAYTDPENVFLTADGRAIARSTVTKLFKRGAHHAGMSAATVHWLRHTFAITMFRELEGKPDINPWKQLQVILGHQSLITTMDIYLEALEANEASISDSVEQVYDRAIQEAAT